MLSSCLLMYLHSPHSADFAVSSLCLHQKKRTTKWYYAYLTLLITQKKSFPWLPPSSTALLPLISKTSICFPWRSKKWIPKFQHWPSDDSGNCMKTILRELTEDVLLTFDTTSCAALVTRLVRPVVTMVMTTHLQLNAVCQPMDTNVYTQLAKNNFTLLIAV